MPKNQTNINYKTISCTKIPEHFLDKLVAKTHFGKFGKISRFILRPNRLCCNVEYETEEAAKLALAEGANFNGHEFTINYGEHEVTHVQNTEEWVDPDVQDELNVMYPGHWTQRAPVSRISIQKFQKLKYIPSTNFPGVYETGSERTYNHTKYSNILTNHVNAANSNVDLDLETTKINENVRSELESQIRRQALTDEEKYRVLDARDKLIRLKTKRQTDIKKVKVTKGICPDMCPEKERLMREFQRQVSSFELSQADNESTKISHKLAIKQYSRSSADQEVPLAHELRPENVLELTMLYLTHRIMDLCDDSYVSIGDWFHFVWDRTRSIRKDITQQELCSLRAVKLVEQCARFHIHCAGRLMGEDPSVFDTKINMENLTKCLQTLKYMYHDLRLKNIFCPCEAEFRSYVILLNLGDSNFLWELKHLPENIQNDVAIRQAIAFYNALQNNNYVRFFNMLRSNDTSYLSSCILLNYFTILRLRALAAIDKTYRGRKNYGHLPIAYITHILGYEDESSAIDFLEYHGLNCEKDIVILDNIRKPNIEYNMNRALKMVESKRQVLVGECVNAGPLESFDIFEKHQPHNSFDEDGYLKLNAWSANDQLRELIANKQHVESNKKESEISSLLVKPQIKSPPIPQKTDFENIFKIPMVSSPILLKQSLQKTPSLSMIKPQFPLPTIKSFKCEVSPLHFNKPFEHNEILMICGIPLPVSTSLNTANISPIILHEKSDNTAINTFDVEMEKRKFELEEQQESDRLLLQKELKRMNDLKMIKIENLSENMIGKILYSHILTEIDEIARSEIAKLEHSEFLVKSVYSTILTEVVVSQTKDIIWDEYLQEMCDKRLLKRHFLNWLKIVRDNFKIRKLISEPKNESPKTFLLRHPFEQENLNFMKRYRQGQSCDFSPLLNDDVFNKTMNTSSKLNIFDLISGCIATKKLSHRNGLIQNRKYFKLLISVPDAMDELPNFNKLYDKWLNEDIYIPSQPHNPNNEHGFICALQDNLGLCVRKITGIRLYNEQRQTAQKQKNECSNADAVIFLMTCFNLRNTIKRLKLFLASMKNKKRVPIAFIVYNGKCDEELLTEHLCLEEWYDSETLLSHKFYGCYETKSSFNFVLILKDALNFLCKDSLESINERDKLEMQTTQSWLETNLGEEIWQRWELSRKNNPAFAKLCQHSNHVINIYQEALQRLNQMINFDYEKWPELAEELKVLVPEAPMGVVCSYENFPNGWTNTRKRELLLKFLDGVTLPKLIDILPKNIKELQLYMLKYGTECIPGNHEISTIASYETIKVLIHELNRPELQHLEVEHRLNCINYLPVIKTMVFQRINYLLSFYINKKEYSLPSYIIYMRDLNDAYKNHPWWLNNQNMQNISIEQEYKVNEELRNISSDQHKFIRDFEKDMETILSIGKRSVRKITKRLKKIKNYEGDTHPKYVYASSSFKMEKHLKDCIQSFELRKQGSEEYMKMLLENSPIEDKIRGTNFTMVNNSEYIELDMKNSNAADYEAKRRRISETDEDGSNVSVAAIISKAEDLLKRFEETRKGYRPQIE